MSRSAISCGSCGSPQLVDGPACTHCGVPWAIRPRPAPVTGTDAKLRLAGNLAIAGGVAVVVGSFLPWMAASVPFLGTMTTSGIELFYGWLTVAAGVIAVVFGASLSCLAPRAKSKGKLLAVAAVLCAVVVMFGLALSSPLSDDSGAEDDLFGLSDSDFVVMAAGSGLYAIGGGAIAIGAGALMLDSPRRRSA